MRFNKLASSGLDFRVLDQEGSEKSERSTFLSPKLLDLLQKYSALVVRDYSHHSKTHVCDIHFTTEFVGDQMIPAIAQKAASFGNEI